MKRVGLLVICVFVAVLVVGCGDDQAPAQNVPVDPSTILDEIGKEEKRPVTENEVIEDLKKENFDEHIKALDRVDYSLVEGHQLDRNS